MTTRIYQPVGLPPDARSLMNFSEEVKAKLESFSAEAERDHRWESTQDLRLSLQNLEAIAYWIYKTRFPVTKAKKNSNVEMSLQPFKKRSFDLLPENFRVDAEVSVSTVGDLMCCQGLEHSSSSFYDGVDEIIFGADISFANLESTLTTSEIVPTSISTSDAPMINLTIPQYETLMYHAGRHYDIVQLANNHIMDCGEEGIETTLARLERDGVIQTGVNESQDDVERPVIIEREGIRIGWIAHTFGLNWRPLPQSKPWLVNVTPFHMEDHPSIEQIEKQIRACRSSGCDLVFVCLHWGLEFELFPHPDQLVWARQMADGGADLIIGHHTHVPQPVEIYRPQGEPERAVPIIYSLGNLTSIISNPASTLSMIARLRIVRGTYQGVSRIRVAGLELHPVAFLRQGDNLCVRQLARLEPDRNIEASYYGELARYADLVIGPDWRHSPFAT